MTMAKGEVQVRVAGWISITEKQVTLKIDGRIGPITMQAIRNFQKAYGISATGTVNAQTERQLRAIGQRNGFPEHFYAHEFKTKSGTGFSGGKVSSSEVKRNARRLAWKLEAMRKKSGGNVTWVNSAFRSIAHNSRVGGSSNSMHMYGIAADVTIKNMTVTSMVRLAKSCGFSSVIRYATHVHVDSRVEYSYGSRKWYWP